MVLHKEIQTYLSVFHFTFLLNTFMLNFQQMVQQKNHRRKMAIEDKHCLFSVIIFKKNWNLSVFINIDYVIDSICIFFKNFYLIHLDIEIYVRFLNY